MAGPRIRELEAAVASSTDPTSQATLLPVFCAMKEDLP
jgi:hypothetical protein